MKARRGIDAVVVATALAAACSAAWAQAGVTDKVGQTRVTTVPAPLPQAVPAGQGVRPSTVSKPSVALPSAPAAPVAPNAPETAVLTHKAAPAPSTALPSTSLTRPDAEVAPVAPSLAAHGLPITAMAPPAAGLTGDAAAVAKKPKPKAEMPRLASTAKAGLRKPADAEPRLRPEPALAHKPVARATVPKPAPAKTAKSVGTRAPSLAAARPGPPQKPQKPHHRLNDGSRP
jgi:hypothetical protein